MSVHPDLKGKEVCVYRWSCRRQHGAGVDEADIFLEGFILETELRKKVIVSYRKLT